MNQEEYNQRKIDFESQKDSLPKEPSGTDVKKEYWVGCYTKDDWEFIHVELMKDGSLEDNIPTDICECPNDCLQSETRGIYLLTDTEATALQNHPKVKYLHINTAKYPGTYLTNPDDIVYSEPTSKTYRYASTVKHQRDPTISGIMATNPDSTLLNRGGYQLKRHQQKIDPWYGQDDSTVLTDRIQQFGTGVDVDVIVCDQDMWFGHIEFLNPSGISNIKQSDNSTAASTSAPSNYVGTNVLKSGFSSSSTTGYCEVLDLVLDAPYYIDKAWFEADASNRLTERWDGTTVPVESVAREWWSDSSKRSASFSSAGTISSSSISSYTRATCNGSNTAYHTGTGFHGTPCASQAYGRQYGWAYNANKWFLNLYGSSSIGLENGFDIQKIFHQNKPNRSSDNTKNPTISSNSWGLRQSTSSSGYYYFREGATGGSGTSYSTRPAFMSNFYGGASASRCNEYVDGHAAITAGDELIASGVIFCCAAGNHNQKLVQSNHADYNNYYASSANTNYADAKTNSIYSLMNYTATYNSTNRPGFPEQIGVDRSTTPFTYKTIGVGALDDDHTAGGLERKASYSNMGNIIDCWASADTTIAAGDDNTGTRYNRYDAYYSIGSASTYNISVSHSGSSAYTLSGSDRGGSVSGNNAAVDLNVGDTVNFSVNASGHPFWIKTTNSTGTGDGASGVSNNGSESGTVSWTPDTAGTYYYICQYHSSMVGQINVTSTSSVESEDITFSGTSSATPIAVGLIAAKLQYNRTWTYADVKNWLASDVGDTTTSYFYSGTEATTATDSNWTDTYNLQGSNLRIIYDAAASPSIPDIFALKLSTGNLILSGPLTIKTPPKIITTNLVLHLDAGNSNSYVGTGTTWTDLSSSSNNGTLTNGVTYSSDNGGVLVFDGTDDYVVTSSDMFNANANFTFSMWFNSDSFAVQRTFIADVDNSQSLFLRYNNGIQLVNSNTAILGSFSSSTLSTNTWYNITLTKSSTTYTLYINGSSVSSLTGISHSFTHSPTTIGANNNNAAPPDYKNPFDGKIGQVLVYSSALSDDLIQQNYNALKSRYGY